MRKKLLTSTRMSGLSVHIYARERERNRAVITRKLNLIEIDKNSQTSTTVPPLSSNYDLPNSDCIYCFGWNVFALVVSEGKKDSIKEVGKRTPTISPIRSLSSKPAISHYPHNNDFVEYQLEERSTISPSRTHPSKTTIPNISQSEVSFLFSTVLFFFSFFLFTSTNRMKVEVERPSSPLFLSEDSENLPVNINIPSPRVNNTGKNAKKYSHKAIANYGFTGRNDNELTFQKGDEIFIISKEQGEEMWFGNLNGVLGYFPSNYVTVVKISRAQNIKLKTQRATKIQNLAQRCGFNA